MNDFQIIAQQKVLDTYDNINISLNYQIEDILDITKRNSSYSKTIILPGTPENNKFFKRIFQVDVDSASFNPVKKISAELRIGDNQLIKGDLQLLNVVINNGLVEYEIIITGLLRTILFDFGDLTLRNLDLSEYNHQRSKTNIQNSWQYTIKSFNEDVNVGEGGTGYVYPYIINGNSQDILNNLYAYDIFPAVYVKTIIDKIFDLAGTTYSSNFFNSDYFKKLILPYVNDKIEKDETKINQQTTIVGINASNGEQTSLFNQYSSQFSEPFDTGYRSITPLMWYGYQWYKNDTTNYYIGFDRESGEVGDKTFQDPLNSFAPSLSPTQNKYTCQESGYYDINFNAVMVMKYINTDISVNTVKYQDGDFNYYYRLFKINASGTASNILDTSEVPETFTPSTTNTQVSPWYDTGNKMPLSLAASNIYLEQGDRIVVFFGLQYPEAVDWDGNDDKIIVQALLEESEAGIPAYLEVVPSSNIETGTNANINMNQVLPNEVKIKDFFLDIVKMFNLIVADNPDKDKDFIIEPRDDYYRSKQKVKDWTYKIDNDSDIKIIPMSELDAKIYTYTYRQDEDYYNNEYFSDTKRIYGDSILEVDNDFSNETNTLELLFSPTPNASNYIDDRVAPFFIDLNDNQMSSRKVNTRILFYGGLQNTNTPYRLKDYASQADNEGVVLTKYPYCGMWDNPTNPIYDLAFDNAKKIYFNSGQYPLKTLMDKFHKSTFNSITDINSRLMEAMFYLTPKDIATFDYRDIILIDNVYWRINKIVDYDPVSIDKLTKVILFKINDLRIFSPDNVQIPASNSACPTDVVGKLDKKGRRYYVSASGQIISAECCKSLKGTLKNGVCWVNGINRPPFDPISATGGGVVEYPLSTISDKITTNQQTNFNSPNSPNIPSFGRNNYIGKGASNSIIIGNNNSILPNGSNNIIIGDGLTATEPNTIYLDGIKINNDGIVSNYVYIIDGGENTVMDISKTNLIDILDAGINSVRNYGGDSKLRPIIDGSIPLFGNVYRPDI